MSAAAGAIGAKLIALRGGCEHQADIDRELKRTVLCPFCESRFGRDVFELHLMLAHSSNLSKVEA